MTKRNSMPASRSILRRPISILSIFGIFIVLSVLSNLYILSQEVTKQQQQQQHNIRHYNHHHQHHHHSTHSGHHRHHRNLDYFELADKVSNNRNVYDYNEPTKKNADQKTAMVSCPSCLLRLEQLKFLDSDNIRLEAIKQQILLKLGLKSKPNVTQYLSKKVIMDTLSRYENDIFLSRQPGVGTGGLETMKNTSSRSGHHHQQHHHRTDRTRDSSKSNDQQHDDATQFEPSKIIAFAEQGGSMNGNKILEFSISKDISNGHGSKVLSAHLWLKIEKITSEPMDSDVARNEEDDEGRENVGQDKDRDTDEPGENGQDGQDEPRNRARKRGRGRVMVRKRTRVRRSTFCKPKVWVFKVSETAATDTFTDQQRVSSKTFERITELVASRPIDLDHLISADTNWHKINVTDALRDWGKVAVGEAAAAAAASSTATDTTSSTTNTPVPDHTKLRLLVDCSGCCHQIYVHRYCGAGHFCA